MGQKKNTQETDLLQRNSHEYNLARRNDSIRQQPRFLLQRCHSRRMDVCTPQILSFVPGPILFVPTEIKILSSSLAELAACLVVGCMPTFPQLFRQSIPKVSAGLRGYWSRARTSLLTSNHSHQPLTAKGSWESRERTHN